ncbi:DUF934 domain-containing protein [Parahaliea sp. F7430]|uniref:DUF934 domain-containing protein n=1 Tax=Sediminihaliea albiluteola TaxID=2758564 RepID=A0A7W2TUI2_9GAMM|nr:DUF934 domain-containing protein [Sediminihaliea albiluteola]MBA6412201.1 DUF934 domain-containing protein [Sediminihaliea albiluteola]
MPKLIKGAEIVNDERWKAPQPDAETVSEGVICTLAQWQALDDKAGSAVQLEPGDDVHSLLPHLQEIELIAVNFPVFTDGRGFSYARELRENGYQGELRAVGAFIRDQLHYLSRVGFDAFQLEDESQLEAAIKSLEDFSVHYQASISHPLPLFRRRS